MSAGTTERVAAGEQPDAPAAPPARRKRKLWRILAIVVGSLVVLALAGYTAFLLYFGPDRPEQWEGRVADIEKTLLTDDAQGAVLLTGSSYFEYWTSSGDDLAPLDTVNVGIGGTKIGEQIHYIDRLVTPFQPSALVVYAGSNDISGLPFFSKTADQVVPKVQEYVELVHERFPDLPVYYVAITEAPSREGVRGEIQEANRQLAEWADETGEITFIDTAPALLTSDGEIDGSIFGSDRLHLNDEGYEMFAAAIREVLVEDLAPSAD